MSNSPREAFIRSVWAEKSERIERDLMGHPHCRIPTHVAPGGAGLFGTLQSLTFDKEISPVGADGACEWKVTCEGVVLASGRKSNKIISAEMVAGIREFTDRVTRR